MPLPCCPCADRTGRRLKIDMELLEQRSQNCSPFLPGGRRGGATPPGEAELGRDRIIGFERAEDTGRDPGGGVEAGQAEAGKRAAGEGGAAKGDGPRAGFGLGQCQRQPQLGGQGVLERCLWQ